MIRIKIVVQKLWISGLDWDDELPGEHAIEVKAWFYELKELLSIQLSRCLKKNAQEKEKHSHIFRFIQ